MERKLRHVLIKQEPEIVDFQSIAQGGGGKKLPQRDTQAHARRLEAQLREVRAELAKGDNQPRAFGVSTSRGVVLQIDGPPDLDILLQKLDERRESDNIEILKSEQRDDKSQSVVLRIPVANIGTFDKYLNDFALGTGPKKNADLITCIEDIRVAPLQALWSEPLEHFPATDAPYYWELWLQLDSSTSPVAELFRREAREVGMDVSDQQLHFPDRCVVVAHGSARQLLQCPTFMNHVAELRRARETAEYLKFRPREQQAWVEELSSRVVHPPVDAPTVCILDGGVTPVPPLVVIGLDEADCLTCDPSWGRFDTRQDLLGGHGTRMAGLALFGDLVDSLDSHGSLTLTHRLESVKILPDRGENRPENWGSLTTEAVARAEVNAPTLRRVFCTAVTETRPSTSSSASGAGASRLGGRPSAWSGAVDQLAAGGDDSGFRRLFLISAGNTAWDLIPGYPETNERQTVLSPAQAWNALTVGAFTQKCVIYDTQFKGFTPLARTGDLSPLSSTSVPWCEASIRPIKPEILMEGGNYARSVNGSVDTPDDLMLLTTERPDPFRLRRPFHTFGDTSAATALASRMAGILTASYPDFWPETVRGLMVHSAEWTPAMLERYLMPEYSRLPLNRTLTRPQYLTELKSFERKSIKSKRRHLERLLRCCGWGVPDLDRARYSASNALTLVAQEMLTPFEQRSTNGNVSMRDMHLIELPWPKEVLESLEETPVILRVTLSYFVEPSPGERGWKYRFRYASHGLRFALKNAGESGDRFRKRINVAAREEEEKKESFPSNNNGWLLGPKFLKENCGSIQSDIWFGTARDLAACGMIGIYPVIGWWRERPELRRADSRAFYSLIISIETPSSDVDLYTPVYNQVENLVLV